MRPSTALNVVSVILVAKAVLIGWITWGRAHLLGVEAPAGQAGLTIATVALVIALGCAGAGSLLRRHDRAVKEPDTAVRGTG